MVAWLTLAACSDELEHRGPVEYCVQAAWQSGRPVDNAAYGQPEAGTRALTNTDLLAAASGSPISIAFADYPETISVMASNNREEPFTLTKGDTECSTHHGFYNYSSELKLDQKKIEKDNIAFTATATIDGGDLLTTGDNEVTKENLNGDHLQFTLHHTQALLRFAFKVDEDYDKIRYILVTGIQLNDSPCTLVRKVLNTTSALFVAYAYVDPEQVTVSRANTIKCTYDIYDKDADTELLVKTETELTEQQKTELATHCTRKAVTATNQFKLSSLKDASNQPVAEIKSGYYYDMIVTLNPDYLYVLSEHDDKQLTVK